MLEFRIDSDHAGVRLDKVLRQRLPRVPPSHLQKMIRTKKVRVNGRRARPEQPLARGGRAHHPRRRASARSARPRPPPRAPAPEEVARLRILHEDAWMMAVDKPSGLAVHPGSGIRGGTLVDLVRAHLGPKAERNGFSASPAHRLDRETSGVIVVAKRRPAMVHFTEVFTHGGARKQYLTLAKGTFPRAEGRIDLPAVRAPADGGVEGAPGGQHAGGRDPLPGAAAREARRRSLEVTLETGRTHQIRRHLAAIGHPVAGDRKYGDFGFNREVRARWGLKRLFLHAERLEVPHPETRSPGPPRVAAAGRARGRAPPRRHPGSGHAGPLTERHVRLDPVGEPDGRPGALGGRGRRSSAWRPVVRSVAARAALGAVPLRAEAASRADDVEHPGPEGDQRRMVLRPRGDRRGGARSCPGAGGG